VIQDSLVTKVTDYGGQNAEGKGILSLDHNIQSDSGDLPVPTQLHFTRGGGGKAAMVCRVYICICMGLC
jgi:hypothetical protein